MSTLLTLPAPRLPLLCFTKPFAVLVLFPVSAASVVVGGCGGGCTGGGCTGGGCTDDWIVIGTDALAERPQLYHDCTTVLYLPGASFNVVSSLAPFTTYTR